MSFPANIRVNMSAPFPAIVKGSAPVTISRRYGIWTVGFTISNLATPQPGTDPATLEILLYNTTLRTFQQTSLMALRAVTPTPVVFAQSPYVPLATDTVLLVDGSAGAVTINLRPSATRSGVPLLVKDGSGTADVHNITINRNGAETIDGLTQVVLRNPFAWFTLNPKAGGYYET